MPLKRCSKCKEFKTLEHFYNNKNTKDGKYPQCNQCKAQYNQEHKEEIAERKRKYHLEHREELLKHQKEWREEHKEYQKKWRAEHKEEIRQYNQEHKEEQNKYAREYQEKNKEGLAEHRKEWQDNNKEWISKYFKNRRIIDPWFRLNSLMSNAIRGVRNPSIKQGRSWKQLVPYTLIQLRKHLKSTLPDGYTWKDFMQGKLHIDHILPKAIFKYEKSEDLDFQICWGLDNLRLLPAEENIRKKAKLIKSFQKNFKIEVKLRDKIHQ